jgi:phosphatidate cytidylyltransferase
MKNIFLRTLTGTIYVTLILSALLIDPLGLKILVLLLNLIALLEYNRIIQHLNIRPVRGWIAINMFMLLTELFLIHFGKFGSFTFIPWLIYFLIIPVTALYQSRGNPVISASFAIAASIIITLPLMLLVLVHDIALSRSVPFTLAVFIFIWTNDTFAYITGQAFGRHKLFERISPKKSWEGFIGGLLATAIAGYIMSIFFPAAGLSVWIPFALLIALASVFGDFTESLLKRTADVKDSGNILPGHGGILDRIDSLLFAVPVAYIYLQILYTINL